MWTASCCEGHVYEAYELFPTTPTFITMIFKTEHRAIVLDAIYEMMIQSERFPYEDARWTMCPARTDMVNDGWTCLSIASNVKTQKRIEENYLDLKYLFLTLLGMQEYIFNPSTA